MAAAPSFVTNAAPSRASAQSRTNAVRSQPMGAVNLSSLAVAGVATSALVVNQSRKTKVARNFFGGESTSYASFDPAKELGVQEPIGFWDPLGLSADKDEATFKRRRAVEIKHGRIVTFSFWVEVLSLLKL